MESTVNIDDITISSESNEEDGEWVGQAKIELKINKICSAQKFWGADGEWG